MGTDFNVKPIGASATAMLPQPASEAPHDAVATQLPASQAVAASSASARLRNDPQSMPGGTSHQVILDRSANTIVYQVVDNRTSLVIRQYPEEAILRRRAYFRTLDMMKEDRAREPETDRTA